MSELESRKIVPANFSEFLAWAHSELQRDELQTVEIEVFERLQMASAPLPREIVFRGQRMAGAYFTCLPGNLAILGAVRTQPKCQALGSQLLRELVDELRAQHSIDQIQAAISDADQSAERMLGESGFSYLASIDQMWRSNDLDSDFRSRSGLHWTDTKDLSEAEFRELLDATFQGSLDCPELNGWRSKQQVMDSFLMGRKLCDIRTWLILWRDNRAVGCLLLEDHRNSVCEVAYMGLMPSVRHQGLGKVLVEKAIERVRHVKMSGVVLAVDKRNVPALKIYSECGFKPLRQLRVFIVPKNATLTNSRSD